MTTRNESTDSELSVADLADEAGQALPDRELMSLVAGSAGSSLLSGSDVLPGVGSTDPGSTDPGATGAPPDGGVSSAAADSAGQTGSAATAHLPSTDGTYSPTETSTSTS
jgi:hypothetical protein